MTSPVAALCNSLMHQMSGATEYASFFDDARRQRMLRSVFETYYADAGPDKVVFDTNRNWTAKTALLGVLYPEARIICCVREIAWILDSIERLVRRNSLQPSKMFNYKTGGSVYSRVEILMEPDKGLVGLAWSALREAWFGESARQLIVVTYDSLARQPREVMSRLYTELQEPEFAHDFENISFDMPVYDADLGIPGLHQVRPSVSHIPRESCLPPDLVAKFAEVNFWLNLALNRRQILVI